MLSEIPRSLFPPSPPPFSLSHHPSITIPPSASHDSAILIVPSPPLLARFQRWRHFGIRLPMVTTIVFHGLIFLGVSTLASVSLSFFGWDVVHRRDSRSLPHRGTVQETLPSSEMEKINTSSVAPAAASFVENNPSEPPLKRSRISSIL